MNNLDCTQKVIFEKLFQYSKKSDVALVNTVDQTDFISIMYRFLNATIDNRYQTSARVVTTSKKGLLGKFAIFCKKVFRKMSFWYVEPICKSQTQFNEMCTQFCINTYYLLDQMQKEKQNKEKADVEVKKQLQSLHDKLRTVCVENDELKRKLKTLELVQTDLEKECIERIMLREEVQHIQDKLIGLEKEYAEKNTFKEAVRRIQEELGNLEKEYGEKNVLKEEVQFMKEKLSNLEKECDDKNILKEEVQRIHGTIIDLEEARKDSVHLKNELLEISENMQTIKIEFPYLFESNKNDFWNKQTVAQSGEDAILAYIMMVLGIDYKNEYYLDLGANHARELSNTYMLYKNGMRGVLVEANQQLISELKFLRSEDVILNRCIANESGQKIKFYVMNGNGLSSSDLNSVNEAMEKNPALAIDEIIEVESITVNDIFNQYFDKGPLVLNIDIEGLEEDILRYIDYEKYAPKIVIVERIDYDTTIATSKRIDDIHSIMEEKGYFEYAFTGINSIYINYQWLKELKK